MSSTRYFSPDYATARNRFRAAIAAQNGRLDVLKLQDTGPGGEELTIDVGWFGAAHPERALVHSCGLHGVEGFAGSAIQLQWLEEGIAAPPDDAAIAIVHALNPYGAAWLRRVNEHNVDLNRNFRAPDDDGADPGRDYPLVDDLLNPQSAPRHDLFYARAAALVLRYGMARIRLAVVSGQRINPRGLFYAGSGLEPGPRMYQDYLAEKLRQAHRITAIDVHTGWGRYGEDTLLLNASANNFRANQAMREIFGERTQLDDNDAVAYRVRGAQHDMYYRLFPRAEVHFATQEFGTFSGLRVLAALRAENRWHHYGQGTVEHPATNQLLHVFCPDDETWRAQVLRRGSAVVHQACALSFNQEEKQRMR